MTRWRQRDSLIELIASRISAVAIGAIKYFGLGTDAELEIINTTL